MRKTATFATCVRSRLGAFASAGRTLRHSSSVRKRIRKFSTEASCRPDLFAKVEDERAFIASQISRFPSLQRAFFQLHIQSPASRRPKIRARTRRDSIIVDIPFLNKSMHSIARLAQDLRVNPSRLLRRPRSRDPNRGSGRSFSRSEAQSRADGKIANGLKEMIRRK